MEINTCEQYVLLELEAARNELQLVRNQYEELDDQYLFECAKSKNLQDELNRLKEMSEALKIYILNRCYIEHYKTSTNFDDSDFAINYKQDLLKLGITKVEMEEYAKARLREDEQNDNNE